MERIRSRVRCRAWPCWSMRWLWMPRGRSWRDFTTVSLCLAVLWLIWRDKAAKRGIGWVLAPYLVFRDCRVRWEHGRRIKCPASRTRDRWREASLCSRPVDSYEPLPYSTVAVKSSLCRFAPPLFRVQGYGWCRALVLARASGASSQGPDLCMGPLVMSIGWGTPYWYPRQQQTRLKMVPFTEKSAIIYVWIKNYSATLVDLEDKT
jgi:hypothetical protein